MYQVIEKLYVGIDQELERHRDDDHIEIERLAFDDENVLNYTGNYRHQDWSITVYGCYESLAKAQIAVKTIFGDVRATDPRGNPFPAQHSNVIAVFKPGKYHPVGCEKTLHATRDSIAHDVTALTSDEEIDELATIHHDHANRHGFSYHRTLRDMMIAHREL
jgi:hypothetical protein